MRTVEDSKKINDVKTPAIIISASGMATGGRVLHHLAQRAPDRRNAILLAGFQAEGTRGRSLEEGAKTLAHSWPGCSHRGGSSQSAAILRARGKERTDTVALRRSCATTADVYGARRTDSFRRAQDRNRIHFQVARGAALNTCKPWTWTRRAAFIFCAAFLEAC